MSSMPDVARDPSNRFEPQMRKSMTDCLSPEPQALKPKPWSLNPKPGAEFDGRLPEP
jgi:hypothetical protein